MRISTWLMTVISPIRKITPDGGCHNIRRYGWRRGDADGTGSAATFNGPFGLAIDTNGDIFVTDTDNGTIRKITPAGVVTTIAGTPGTSGNLDGTGSDATFENFPERSCC